MKSILGLYWAFALCLLPWTALAADADTDVAKVVVLHPAIAIIGSIMPVLIRALREDVNGFITFPAKYRLLTIGVLSAVSAVIDQLVHGANVTAALVAVGVTAAPALFVEVLHLIFGRKDGGDGSVTTTTTKKVQIIPPIPPLNPPPAPPYSTKIVGLVLLSFALSLPGCSALQAKNIAPTVDTILADIQEASSYVSAVDALVHVFFGMKPNPELQAKVDKVLADTKVALLAGIHATNGAKDLTADQKEKAFAEFAQAYGSLETLLQSNGIVSTPGKLGAQAGAVHTPPLPALLRKRGGPSA